MPHVVVEGAVDLRRFVAAFEPIAEVGTDEVRKIGEVFLNRRGDTALLEALVIERGHRQRFFVLVSRKGQGVTVRLEPATQPEKTPGVKRLLAAVARQIRARFPNTRYGKTNLADSLEQ